MDIDPPHAERVGDETGVLAAGAAEAGERVLRHVIAALDRDLLDRVRHVLDGDLEEAGGDRRRAAAIAGRGGDLGGERGEFRCDDVAVERLVAVRAEHAREEIRLQLAEHDVAVGDGKRAAAAIARRPRHRTRRFRPDAIARAVEEADRAAARGDGVDIHHRRAQPHARHHGLEAALILAGIVRHVGRSPAHVEADDLVEPGHAGGSRRPDDAARRPGQDRVLALEAAGIDQAAIRLHEQEPRAAELGRDLGDIAAEDRREIGIDDGGVAAAHQLHQRTDAVAHRDLGEADLVGERGDQPLVRGIAIAMHQHDRRGADAGGEGGGEIGAHARFVGRAQDLALGGDALVDFDDALVERLGQHDLASEQLGPVLVADAQRVGEALGDDQERAFAFALQQRVGGNGGADLHRRDRVRRQFGVGAHAENVADGGQRRVAIAAGIVGQQLARDESAIGTARHHVGKSAAAVDPELPAHAPIACASASKSPTTTSNCIGAPPARPILRPPRARAARADIGGAQALTPRGLEIARVRRHHHHFGGRRAPAA